MSRAETVNEATKYLRDFIEHIPDTLDGHIFDGRPSDEKASSQVLREF